MGIDFEEEKLPNESSGGNNLHKRPRSTSNHDDRDSQSKSRINPGSSPYHELWLDKYEPKSVKSLAIHPKKIDEVRQWLMSRTRKSIPHGRTQVWSALSLEIAIVKLNCQAFFCLSKPANQPIVITEWTVGLRENGHGPSLSRRNGLVRPGLCLSS